MPKDLLLLLQNNNINACDIVVPVIPVEDKLIWEGSPNEKLTVEEFYEQYREKGTIIARYEKLWQKYLPPRISMFAWKCLQDRLPIDVDTNNRGIIVQIGCVLCDDSVVLEDQNHILLKCDFVKLMWDWISILLQLDICFIQTITELLRWCSRRNLKD